MDETVPKILGRTPLFRGLVPEDLAALAAIGRRRRLVKGGALFLAGAPAEGFWVVLSGGVKLVKVNVAGKEQILHVHRPAESFAEATLSEGARYPAQAVATEDGEALLIPRAELQGLLAKRPVVATNLIARLSQRLRAMTGLVEDLSLRDAPARVAHYLLTLAGRSVEPADRVTIPILKAEVASLLGTRQETLSRAFRHLSDLGLIEVRGSKVEILDPDGLQDASEGEL